MAIQNGANDEPEGDNLEQNFNVREEFPGAVWAPDGGELYLPSDYFDPDGPTAEYRALPPTSPNVDSANQLERERRKSIESWLVEHCVSGDESSGEVTDSAIAELLQLVDGR